MQNVCAAVDKQEVSRNAVTVTILACTKNKGIGLCVDVPMSKCLLFYI